MTKSEFLAEVRTTLALYKERLAHPGRHDIVIRWAEHDPELVAIVTDSYRRIVAHLESREVKPWEDKSIVGYTTSGRPVRGFR